MTERRQGRGARSRVAAVIALALFGCGSSEGSSLEAIETRDGAQDDAAQLGEEDGGGVAVDSEVDAAAQGDGDGDGDGGGDGRGDPSDAATADATATVEPSDASRDADSLPDAALPALDDLPYAREVIAYEEGESAGFGQSEYPDIVLGPPTGKGSGSGSLDVLSLGVGGSIVVGFGDIAIIDGAGPDFIVFENAFIGAGSLFMELGEVSVSENGVTWHTFPCDEGGAGGEFPGCAGWTPTLRFDPQQVFPLDPAQTGGDAFDLAQLGLRRARYVRVRDLGTKPGSANTGGFDLDAVGIVHFEHESL